MNERIRELYQQAHMIREYPEDDPMRGGNPPTVYWGGERSAERFAELIVRECIDCINETDKHYIFTAQDAGVIGAAHNRSIKTIKEHFGVEE